MATRQTTTKASASSFDIFSNLVQLVMMMHADDPHEAYIAKSAVQAFWIAAVYFSGKIVFEPILNK